MNKKILGGLLLFLSMTCSGVYAQEAGRYQIQEVKFYQWDSNTNTSSEVTELWRLDTATGDVQSFSSVVKNGKESRYWSPAVYDQTQ